MFEFLPIRHWDTNDMFGEFLLYSPLRDKGGFLFVVGVCAILWYLWGEWNNKVFRGLGKDPSDVLGTQKEH